MIIELGNKKEIEYLYYLINNEEFNFYYKDTLLFQNNKVKPFLSVILENDNVKKEIPLYNCDIKKDAPNKYNIDFYNKNFRVKSRIILKGNLVNIYITKKEDYQLKLCLINENNNKIIGFGCNNIENWQNKSISLSGNEKPEKKDIIIEKKLCFFIENKMVFYNKNIKEWEVNVERDVIIKTKQNEIFFALKEEKNTILMECSQQEKKYKFLKTSRFLEVKEIKDFDGIVLKNNSFNIEESIKKSSEYAKKDKKILVEISPFFSNKSRIFESLKSDEKVLIYKNKQGELYTYNYNNEETFRKIKNMIRIYLDANCDGFYSMENIFNGYNDYFKTDYGKRWKLLLLEIMKEYPAKILIYDKMEEKRIEGLYKIPLIKGEKNKDIFKYSAICSGICDVIFEEDGKLYHS